MLKRRIIATGCVLALTGVTLFLVVQTSDREAARLLFRNLDRYSYYYDSVRAAEGGLAEQDLTAPQLATRMRAVEQQILFLCDRLNSMDVHGNVRRDLLEPLIHNLRDDRAELASLRDYIERKGVDASARSRLSKHVHSPNIFGPVIGEIRVRYGLRQRAWRGHPLTV